MFRPEHLVSTSKQSSVTVWQMPVAVRTVLKCWWWTERPSETCRVSFQNKMIWCIGASSWFYYGNTLRCTAIWRSNTYLLTPRCRVVEKLTGVQLVKKFPAFHGTRRFITALTSVRHLSLSWASPIQSIYPHHNSWRFVLILSTHLRLGHLSGLFPTGDTPYALQ
jgi:hypothetical protein